MENIRQQIIQARVQQISRNLRALDTEAFPRLVHSVLTDESVYAFNEADLVDGGQDKGIDLITIDETDDTATVYVLQVKYTKSFTLGALVKLKNGLTWLFKRSRAELDTLQNARLKDKIVEYRSLQNCLGPSNLRVIVALVTNALTSGLRQGDEILQEVQAIREEYDNGTFAGFEMRLWGAEELVDKINQDERREKRKDESIRILYDANNPSLIRYHAEGIKGVVCSVQGHEIARIVNDDPGGHVFDANIRRFLGTRGAVNSDILGSCTHSTATHEFWFLNNGVTIVCDSFDAVTDPDDPHIKIRSLQIINGCQTATTLALAQRNGKLPPNVRVLVRVYEAPESGLAEKIVLTIMSRP